ncbi:MAG: DivIVA domain-containing protein [Desulfobacterales bacterium]|nr:DivIVA domain-containing protein [Desulfobacterales bacterium]
MRLTALDIQQQKFRTCLRGFDVREVDEFLEQMARSFEELQTENQQLRDRIERLEHENLGFHRREDTFKRVMLNSQKVIEQMKKNAQKSGELVIADSEVRAEKILNGAHNRLSRLHEDIAELKRQRMQLEVQLRSILESHRKLLDVGAEEARVLDETDAKVQLLKKT